LNDLALSAISLFSGVGMLDEGFRAGLEYMGIQHRTICHVEREAHAASVLVARMEEGSLDAAPIWSDVTTFDAAAWRGKVDCIVAGFPCQDLSVAGKRVGLDGKRSGLFFEVVRIATDSGAWLMLLENVAGIASATATVMDEAEGELDERAAARVVGELADLGWDSEWIVISASDVGASHGRARWFCLAWRMADSARHVGHGSGDRQSGSRRGICEAGDTVDFAKSIGRNQGKPESIWQQGRSDVAEPSLSVADSADDYGRRGIGAAQKGTGPNGCGRRVFTSNRHELADTSSTGLQIGIGGG
jgi:site-specific DNA-cytosine methylase